MKAGLERLHALAARGVAPARLAREVEIIFREWETDGDMDFAAGVRRSHLTSLLEKGVSDAEEQLADVDRDDKAALFQAETTLAALSACKDAALRYERSPVESARRSAINDESSDLVLH